MYNYFISFSLHQNGSQGFGNAFLDSDKKITKTEHIKESAKLMEERNNADPGSVIILSFQLLESE